MGGEGLGVFWGGGGGGEGGSDDLAEGLEVGEVAGAEGLGEGVADGGGFVGADDDGAVEGVGGHLVEEGVLAAAADDVEDFDAVAQEGFEVFEDFGVAEGEALEAAADVLAGGFGAGLVGLVGEGVDFGADVAGGGEGGVVGVDEGAEGLALFGEAGEFAVADVLAARGEVSADLLDEPEAGDVFEETDFVGDAAFVGEAGVA